MTYPQDTFHVNTSFTVYNIDVYSSGHWFKLDILSI
jgi:hypothetical protein